jgi:hypothetical protein
VYGFCETKPGIVMEKSPGRANLATAESDDERCAVLDDYLDRLPIHALIRACSSSACRMPSTAEERSPPTCRAGSPCIAAARISRARDRARARLAARQCPRAPRARVSLVGDSGSSTSGARHGDPRRRARDDAILGGTARCSRDLSEPLGELSRGIALPRSTGDAFSARDVLYQAAGHDLHTDGDVVAVRGALCRA